MTSRGAHFVWSHIVCFSYKTPAGRFNFEFVQTYSNYMTSIWLVCLISCAPLAGATPKYPQHSWEHFKRARCINPACPLFWVCDHSIFSCTNKTRRFNQYAENMVSTLKHRIITEKNNESSTEMTLNYIHVYAYTILNHIQYRYTTRTPHERHGIPNTGNLTFFNSMTWLYNSKGNICTLSYSRRNQLWYITLVLMEPPLRTFVKSMTTKEGLKSLPDRLFVQEYLSAYTYPDVMEIIRRLFLNYFATLCIPLTLPAICRIISLAI